MRTLATSSKDFTWDSEITVLHCPLGRHAQNLEQQERDPSPPSIAFGSASHPVLSHAPLRVGGCALGVTGTTGATLVVPGTAGRRSTRQSAKV